jgi:4-amino-4-deoxy-L-arabinose transferase-like glycosyltransferase
LVACIALCLAGLTYNLTGYALFDPDEGRNAEVAREMATTGDYVLPHINGLPYLDKPILYFAAGAVSIKLLGPNAFAARLPSLLFTLATIFLVGWFARRLFGDSRAGVTAAIATAATPFTLAYARIVIFDSALTFFVVLALVSFYLAIEEVGRADSRTGGQSDGAHGGDGSGESWTALAWVAIALGVLTKGPIAILLPLLIAMPFAIRCRAWRALVDPVAILLFGTIVAPWVIAVSLRVPDFLEYALVTETVRRFSTTELERTGPIWYFLAILPAAALPWSLVLAGAGRSWLRLREADGRLDRRILFLLLWIALPVLFFSLSQSKRPQYILPMIPAVALLIAGSWQKQPAGLPGARWGAGGLVAIGLFFMAASRTIPNLVPANPAIAAAIPNTAIALGAVCFGAGILAWAAHQRRDILLLAFSLPVAAIPFSSHTLLEEIGNERSAALLADAIVGAVGQSAIVVGVGAYPPSLPFYLQQTVIVASADGAELTSNYLMQHIREYRGFGSPLRRADWWQEALLACSRPTVFVTLSRNKESREALGQLDLIMDNGKYVAYGPCGLETLARTDR